MKKLLGLLASALFALPASAQTVTNPSVAALVCAFSTVTPTPTAGQFFYVQCDSNGKLITAGAAPSGAAGGSLKGTYPNPGLADINTIATSLAIGGATIGSNALAVTGTSLLGTWGINGTGTLTTVGTNLGLRSAAGFQVQIGVSGTGDFLKLDVNGDILLGAGPGKLTSPTAGTLQFGSSDAAVAVAQTLRVQSVVAGTAAANGANWTLIGSLPTGTGTSGDIIFQTGVKTGSGTTQGTATTALTIKGESLNLISGAGSLVQILSGTQSYPVTGIGLELAHQASGAISLIQSYDRGGSAWKALQFGALTHTFQISGSTAVSINSTDLTIASGKGLILGNAYVAGVQVPSGYIIIKDSTGTAYKVSVNL